MLNHIIARRRVARMLAVPFAAVVAMLSGTVGACDSIWLSQRVLIDTFLHKYGYTCGGRVDRGRGGVDHCTEIFPGHEWRVREIPSKIVERFT